MVPKQQGLQSPVGYTHSAAGEVGTPPRRRKHNAVSRTLYVTRPLPSEEGETTHHLRRRCVCGCTGCRAQSSSRAKSHKTHKAMLTINTMGGGKIVSTTDSTVGHQVVHLYCGQAVVERRQRRAATRAVRSTARTSVCTATITHSLG